MIREIFHFIGGAFIIGGVIILVILCAVVCIAIVLIYLAISIGVVAAPFILSMLAWKWIFG